MIPRYRVCTVVCHGRCVETTVTSTSAVVRQWIYDVKRHYGYCLEANRLVVGFGLRPYKGQTASIQLCVGRFCLVFQLLYAERIPEALHKFLLNPSITFVGVWNWNDEGDRRMLQISNLNIERLIDAGDVIMSRFGWTLEQARSCLGHGLEHRFLHPWSNNWNAKRLGEEQIKNKSATAITAFTAISAKACLLPLNTL